MALPKRVVPYSLDPLFEKLTVTLACTSQRFYGRIGSAIDPELLKNEQAKTAMQAAHQINADVGHGPASPLMVIQRLRRWMGDGKISLEAIKAVAEFFDEAEDVGLPDEESVTVELAPLIQARIRDDAVTAAIESYSKHGDLSKVVELEGKALRVGQVDTSVGTVLGSESFAEIVALKDLARLSTGVLELDSVLDGGLQSGGLGILVGGSGDGKCHRAGQGILMFDGSVKVVEDVIPGERVMGPNGKPRNVLRINTGIGEMFEVRPIKGPAWQVNADHVLTLVGGREEGATTDVSVREWFTWSARKRASFKLFKPGAVSFAVPQILPLDPYFLGVLLGDGTLGHKSRFDGDLRVTTADAEIVAELRAQAAHFGLRVGVHGGARTAPAYSLAQVHVPRAKPRRTTAASRRPTGVPRFNVNPITRELRELGLWSKGCAEKFIPQMYKVASLSARLALLAGLIDTDGATNRTGYDFISKSPMLATDVAFVARSLGFTARVAECQKGCQTGAVGTYYRVAIFGDDVHRIPVRIPRKRVTPRKGNRDARRSGFTIVPTGNVEPYFGFSLDGDSRYLLDDFTVTHNSMGLSHIGGTALLATLFVAYATLELPREVVLARVKANITGVPINTMLSGQVKNAIRRLEELEHRLGRFVVQEFSPKATTVEDLKQWVANVEQQAGGRKIDVLIVDYGDKLGAKAKKGEQQNEYTGALAVFEGLRTYAAERKIFCWTASQASRQKDSKKRLDLNDVADSMHKIRVADLVVTLNLRDAETEEPQILFYVAKHRTGRSRCEVGPMPTEYERGRICPILEPS